MDPNGIPLQPSQPSPELPKVEPKSGSGFTIASMALFVLVSLGVIVFLYYQNQQLKGMLANYQKPSPTPTATPDPTAGWKTYTNNSGFSFKYPQNFIVQEPSQSGSPSANPKSVSLFVYDSSDSSGTYYNDRYINIDVNRTKPNFDQTPTQLMLGGTTATRYTLSNVNFDVYLVQLALDYVDIYVSNDPTRNVMANQILSTFQFINPTSSPSATVSPIQK